jgi:hypothetical protein
MMLNSSTKARLSASHGAKMYTSEEATTCHNFPGNIKLSIELG